MALLEIYSLDDPAGVKTNYLPHEVGVGFKVRSTLSAIQASLNKLFTSRFKDETYTTNLASKRKRTRHTITFTNPVLNSTTGEIFNVQVSVVFVVPDDVLVTDAAIKLPAAHLIDFLLDGNMVTPQAMLNVSDVVRRQL